MSKKLKGKTQSGFAYEIDEKRLNNYELLEVIGELEENPMVISKMVVMLLGKEQTVKLKDHLRDEEGFVLMDKMNEEITEIFQSQAVKK